MAIVEKDNVVLEIKESEVDRYIDLGYNLTDGKGNILRASIPTDIGQLQKAYMEHTALIEQLKAKINSLEEGAKTTVVKKPRTTKSKDSE